MRSSLSLSASFRSRLLPQSPRAMSPVNGGSPRSPYSSPRRRPLLGAALAAADAASWYCALLLIALIFLSSLRDGGGRDQGGTSSSSTTSSDGHQHELLAGVKFLTGPMVKPCDEIYVVGEGETLHTISDKCKDPFIVERNPHIHDPDDVFPGLVIRIVPLAPEQ